MPGVTSPRPRRRGPRILPALVALFVAAALLKSLSGASIALAQDNRSAGRDSAPDAALVQTAALRSSPVSDAALTLDLRAREQDISGREAAIREREALIAAAEERLRAQIAALETAEADLAATMALADRAAEDDILRLVSVYEAMKPEDAAAVFAEMEPQFAAGFLARLSPPVAASILAGLPPRQAYALSAIVALVATSGGASDDDQIAGTTRKYADLGGTVDNPFVPRTRPNDEVDAGVGAGTSSGGRRPTGSGKTPTGNGSSSGSQSASGAGPATGNPQIGPDGQPLRPLSPDDVFAMSSKMEIGTRRCYERALKEDPFLKVSKIKAMITVKNTGVVSNVTLSSMQGTPLATCLSAAIGRWRFRPSTEGIVSEFALVFEQR